LRLAVLPLVRRIGLRRALVLGIAVNALQFWPLAQAGDLRWLIAWIGVVALSESLYWPILHAASSVTTAGETRGRQIAARQAATGLIAVVAPLLGGFILPRFGPAADFGVAAGLLLLWWDLGAIGGCLAGAATAALTVVPSLAILPASLGVAAMAACMRDRPARGDG
ncbi:MFS transporter, partial [Methylobacterium tarhaniae]|uniref:MFS transporter n=1 Tax=Methylobacterium tarhaniae TaxID=1187852 RepID=UPI00142E3DC1